MNMKRLIVALAAGALSTSVWAAEGDWAHWRGPNYDGSTEASNLPTDFSKTSGVKWKAAMPGPSAATPVIFGDRVFVSSTDPGPKKLLALCLDRKTGKELWRQEVGSGFQLHNRSNYASPSPVTDGKRVVFFYGNGDLAAFSMDGKKLWARNLQEDHGAFTFQWTFSSSPTLVDGLLWMQILQRDEPVHGKGKAGNESFLLGIDPDTGKNVWKHVRPSKANKESLESFATPIPHKGQVLIAGGDVLTGHDPKTGKELWRWGTWNPGHQEVWWRLVPSPVAGDGVALVCAPKRAPVYAVKLADASKAWDSGDKSPVSSDVPTPLFYQGKFFVLSDVRKALSRVDPSTGRVEWTIEMPGRYKWRASPTGADGKIWCMNHRGDVVTVEPATGKILKQIAMGTENDDNIRSSIVVAHGQLFIRTNDTLYCVGQ